MNVFFSILLMLFLMADSFALVSKEDVKSIEEIKKKHGFDESLSVGQKFKLYGTLAKELRTYDHTEKAIEYFEKAINLGPKLPPNIDPFPVYTEYLFLLDEVNRKKAKNFFKTTYQKKFSDSDESKRVDSLKFWKNHFKKMPETDRSFYSQHYKEKNIKRLFKEKKYGEAFKLIKGTDPSNQSINQKLKYDILKRLTDSSSDEDLYCEEMLKKYKKSPAITVEACRYLKSKTLKYGNLKKLIKRAEKEQPQIVYLIKALENLE